MKARVDYAKVSSGVFEAMLGLEQYLKGCGLEIELLHLIKMRASQINGCAYCLDMHWKTRGPLERKSSGSILLMRGGNVRITLTASARRLRGPRR